MKKQKNGSQFGRVILFSVGIMMILLALMNVLLFIFGETALANVHTRRIAGSNDMYSSKYRYEWSLDYDFKASDGQIYNGTTTRRGSDMSVDFENEVVYFTPAPIFNSLSREVKPNLGQIIMLGLGAFLIYVAIKKS